MPKQAVRGDVAVVYLGPPRARPTSPRLADRQGEAQLRGSNRDEPAADGYRAFVTAPVRVRRRMGV